MYAFVICFALHPNHSVPIKMLDVTLLIRMRHLELLRNKASLLVRHFHLQFCILNSEFQIIFHMLKNSTKADKKT